MCDGSTFPECVIVIVIVIVTRVFLALLYNWLDSKVDRFESSDQGGFRRSDQTTDHLMTHRLLDPKSGGTYEWVAKIDFAKPFDAVHLEAIWRSLATFEISKPYVSLLKKLYSNRCATVLTDTESDEFQTARGSKQGDPWSSLLFNSVLHFAMEDDQLKKMMSDLKSSAEKWG